MEKINIQNRIDKIRNFNRFYTRFIGLLDQGLLKTSYSLIQARILFEIAHHENCTLSDLIEELGIDPGYLSRILTNFEKQDLIRKLPSAGDSRRRLIQLLPKGRDVFSILNNRAVSEIKLVLKKIPSEDHQQVINAMETIKQTFSPEPKSATPLLLRYHRIGDVGWIICRHGEYYAEEYGFTESFELLVAEILVKFNQHHDPNRERIWIVEQSGERIGSVMVTDSGNNVAQLRLLLVEPKARGQGLGEQLIRECLTFARLARYRKIKLWTVNILQAAHHLYEKTGFKIVKEEPYLGFGPQLTAQTWERELK